MRDARKRGGQLGLCAGGGGGGCGESDGDEHRGGRTEGRGCHWHATRRVVDLYFGNQTLDFFASHWSIRRISLDFSYPKEWLPRAIANLPMSAPRLETLLIDIDPFE